MIEACVAAAIKKNNKGTVCPQDKQSSMLFVLARSNRRHLHIYFNNSACFVPCQQTILGAVAEFAFSHHNPCFQNLTPTEFMQSLLRAYCLTARRYKAPWAFQTQLYISPAISHGSHLSRFYLTQRCTSDATVFARHTCLRIFTGGKHRGFFFFRAPQPLFGVSAAIGNRRNGCIPSRCQSKQPDTSVCMSA